MQLIKDFINLFFPEVCCICDKALTLNENLICFRCRSELPRTNFTSLYDNELKSRLHGKININFGTAIFYFYKSGISQTLMHKFKYQNRPEIGRMAGLWLGSEMQEKGLVERIDVIIPVPLHKRKERKRGYNQSLIFAKGISEVTQVPVMDKAIKRIEYGESQTKKTREQRWKVAQKAFSVSNPENVKGKKILLVDDVITTGATLEGCGLQLLNSGAAELNIATMAVAK